MARIEEAKPWNESNTDSSPNRGSYRTGVATGAAVTARRVNPNRWQEVAKKLLVLADAGQAEFRDDGGVNRQAKSHTYAARIVFSVALQTDLEDSDDLRDWTYRVAVESRDMINFAKELDDTPSLGRDLSSLINVRAAKDEAA